MFTKAKLITTVLLLVGIMGCDSITTSFTDGYSENPNNPTDAPADKVFVAAQVGVFQFLETHTARKASMWAQYYSGETRQYASIDSYNVTASDDDNPWFLAYVRGLTNLRIARAKYQERSVVPQNQVAATKVLEGLLMGQVAALWGDVPFSEAIQSDSTTTPVYDSQAEVYNNANALLDEAIATLSSSSAAISEDVTSLAGDASKWLRVAYTIKARHLMHMGDASAALTAAQNGVNTSDGTGDLLTPHGPEQDRNMNLWYNFVVIERSGYLQANFSHSAQMLLNGDNAKTDEQARFDFYYLVDPQDGQLVNTEDGGFAAASASYPLVTYIENQLIIAEAEAVKGTSAGDQNAVDALNNTRDYLDNKFETNNYDDLSLLDFQPGGVYAGTTLEQHVRNWTYLAMIGQIEGFNFLRRVDYNVDGLSPRQGSQFPQRYIYPQDERNTNPNIPDPTPGLFEATPLNQ